MKATLIIVGILAIGLGIYFYGFKKDATGLTYKQKLDAKANSNVV